MGPAINWYATRRLILFDAENPQIDFQHGPCRFSLLHLAALTSHPEFREELIRFLLVDKGCNPFLLDNRGYTFLNYFGLLGTLAHLRQDNLNTMYNMIHWITESRGGIVPRHCFH